MKLFRQIQLLILCILLSLSGASIKYAFNLRPTIEIMTSDTKEAIYESVSDTEDKTAEVILELLSDQDCFFLEMKSFVIPISKIELVSKSHFLDFPNPPPELDLVA